MGILFSKRWNELDYEKVLADFDERIQALLLSIEERSRRYRRIRGLLLFSFGLSYSFLWVVFIYDYRFHLLKGRTSILSPLILTYRWIRYKIVSSLSRDSLAFTSDYQTLIWPVRLVWFTFIIMYPILFFLTYKGIGYYYHKILESEASSLKLLKSKQKLKLEELKKQTRYYMMRELVERYEDSDIAGAHEENAGMTTHGGVRHRPIASTANQKKKSYIAEKELRSISSPPTTPILVNEENKGPQTPFEGARSSTSLTSSEKVDQDEGSSPFIASSSSSREMSPALTSPSASSLTGSLIQPSVQPRSWMDRLVDLVLGEESTSHAYKKLLSGSSSSDTDRTISALPVFALICIHCGGHNGLVPEKDYYELRYICPKCGLWNPSKSPMAESQRILPSSLESNLGFLVETSPGVPLQPLSQEEQLPVIDEFSKTNVPEKVDKGKGGKKKKSYRLDSTPSELSIK